MSLVLAGTFRLAPERLEAFRPHILAMLTATRAEDGCVEYAFAQDVADPGLLRVFETWRDQAALDAHFQSPHMKAWREAGAAFGLSDRRIFAYEVAGQRQL